MKPATQKPTKTREERQRFALLAKRIEVAVTAIAAEHTADMMLAVCMAEAAYAAKHMGLSDNQFLFLAQQSLTAARMHTGKGSKP